MKDLQLVVRKVNQLWLRWKAVNRDGDGKLHLIGAEFYGPVLQDCDPLEKSGHIILDLTAHYMLIIPKPYLIKLSWFDIITQEKDIVKFKEMVIEDNYIGHLNQLCNTDRILLDCTGHTTEEESRGHYKMSFQGMVYKEGNIPYDFSS